jgi:hypothetical protein
MWPTWLRRRRGTQLLETARDEVYTVDVEFQACEGLMTCGIYHEDSTYLNGIRHKFVARRPAVTSGVDNDDRDRVRVRNEGNLLAFT